jgi:hypothetical protein
MKNSYLLFCCLLISCVAFSQHKGKIGLTGSLQGSQYGISVPIWVAQKVVLAPAVDFVYGESIGTDFSVGLESRFYLKTEKICPYYGVKIGAAFNIPSSDNTISDKTTTDGVLGIAFGAEYFFVENFSVGVEAQGNMSKSGKDSERFGNPGGINFNLGTSVNASIYF